MQQVIQNIRNGRTLVREIPPPVCLPGHVILAEVASLISVGTERYVVELARKNLLGKLLDRPDQARRLMQKKLGFRYLMDVIPLDATLVRGSHGLIAPDANDGPLLIADGTPPNEAMLPMTALRDRMLAALNLAEE